MDIRKLVEMELRKTLKEADPAAPTIKVGADGIARFPDTDEQSEKMKNDGIIVYEKREGDDEENAYIAKPFFDKGYRWLGQLYKPAYGSNMNSWIIHEPTANRYNLKMAQQILTQINAILGKQQVSIKKIGDIQPSVDALRKAYPSEFPSKKGYLGFRLPKILQWINSNKEKVKQVFSSGATAPRVKMSEGTKLYAVPAELASKGIAFQKLEGNLPDTMSQLVFARQQDLINAGIAYKTAETKSAIQGAPTKAAPPEVGTGSTESEEEYMKRTTPETQQESKLIRKMIIQEVRKALRK